MIAKFFKWCAFAFAALFVAACLGMLPRRNDPPAPDPPLTAEEKEQQAAEYEAERLVREKAAAAKREGEGERVRRNLERFSGRLKSAGIDNSTIRSVSFKGDTLTITVANAWHLWAYQIRLQAAQNLWKLWASIASPNDPDKARISIVDLNGNEVGGSRIFGGIWVQEN